MHVFDVGQGSSTLLATPSGRRILIDGGPDLTVLERLGKHMSFFNRTIDLLILTHPHSDHVDGLLPILNRYTVKSIGLIPVQSNSSRYQGLLATIQKQQIPTINLSPDIDIDIGDGVVLDIVWPTPQFAFEQKNINNASVMMRAMYGEESILLTGDAEKEAEIILLQSGNQLQSSVLTVPHHGSSSSSSTGFLLAVDPHRGIVSAGRNNRFGHPHREVVDRYKAHGISINSTHEDGTISLSIP